MHVTTAVLIVAVPIAIAAMGWIAGFNLLVSARNAVREAWAGIDVQLDRRHELVPKLVQVVGGYATHEQSALAEVTIAGRRLGEARGPLRRGEADDALEGALGPLYALREAHPELRADHQFSILHEQLVGIEDDLAGARRYYNALVRRYTDRRQTFPLSMVAALGPFPPAEYFKTTEDLLGG